MKRSRLIGPLGLLIAAAGLASCSPSTRFTDTWKDPSLTVIDFKKVAVFAITQDYSLRRVAEDELVKSIKKRQAVASYTLIAPEHNQDVEYAKAKVKEAGCDGVITFRILGVDEKTTYVPGSVTTMGAYPAPYYSFGGYYGYAAPMVYEPGYNITEQYVTVETNIYRMSDEKLVWSGRSETVDPSSVTELVRQNAQEGALLLTEKGLIK
jgi:hypothetical protein